MINTIVNNINVAIVEDNQRYIEELALLLSKSTNIAVKGCYLNGEDAIRDIVSNQPDVVLIDIDLPDISGVEVIKKISAMDCPTEFLVLTVHDDDAHLFAALQAGAVGYIVKGTASLDKIVTAINDVINGGAPMSRSIAKRVIETFRARRKKHRETKFDDLTKREFQILDLISQGFNNRKVAETLNISYETVRTHLKNIYQKLHVHTLIEAITLYKNR